MDTVWIRLTTVSSNKENEGYFMFGPTGIVRFEQSNGLPKTTHLFNSTKSLVAEVIEEPEFIMDILGKVRKTKNILNPPKKRRKAR